MGHTVGYQLPIDCSIARVDVLRRDLADLLTQGNALELNGDSVSKIDAIGIQLLVAFVRALAEKGMQWHWTDPSPRLQEAARLLGVSDSLNF